ncbi:HAD family hydrolase [Oceanispirochaeta sp.]|jgi:putative hydrolase of the HAD superfamily|uniref:HAD family hydrolase n=1 Tax=Oceanispirochaeta sp. TaxID=2035350 RepID=UPI0026057B1E|nr:HAD family hydrolase [Oceanispirochaeta sp.]MDA3956483.1 HAD family hydrolase [Oceanispirochaeta sp.]
MALKAVAFDIDGTLYPNWRMQLFSFPFLLTHLPLVMKFSKVRKELRGIENISDFRKTQSELMAARLGGSVEEASSTVETIIYRKWETIFKRVKPYSGLQSALEELKSMGLSLGVMSDFPVGNKLNYFRVDGHWNAVMSSEETGYLKPHAAPFLALARKLGCRPEEVLYVGNSYEYDVKGASAAGMKTVYIQCQGKIVPEADLTIRNFKDFVKNIEFLLREE